jgi:YD repeat-containing protein
MNILPRIFLSGILSGVALLLSDGLQASPAQWEFSPPKAGRALLSGGWMVEYPLGNVSASPDFTFPLQLVYLTTRSQDGLFGDGWFCPQLESSVLPVGKGILLWTTPSGGQVALSQDPDRSYEYRSTDSQWKAKVFPNKQQVVNEEGWEYQYSKGRLVQIVSPGKGVLEFEWDRSRLLGIQIRDMVSNRRRLLFIALYDEDKRLTSFKLDGLLHRFAYVKDGTHERLSAWEPPVGEGVRFLYHPETGILTKAGIGNTGDPARIEEFKTRFVDPKKSAAPTLEDEAAAKKQAANYWLIADRDLSYGYGCHMEGKKPIYDPSDVTVTTRAGLAQKTSYSEKRGIVTTSQNGAERKSYYYRAPGQKYDGKLRRVEENGRLIAEYRYDRKSGLLTETIDDSGVSTFFDYDPNYRPSKRPDWDPKPLRVRRGNRRKSEIVAEYAYSEDGKVIGAKDRNGDLTRYTYTARGQIATVTNPAGDTVSYTYDDFGRMNSVSSSGRTERMEYDDYGRVKNQIAADGSRTEVVYDADGQVSQIKRNGKVTKELVRDEFHRVVGEKDSLNRLSRLERDFRGNLLSQTAPNGSITRYEYDASDRRIAQIDGNGNRIAFEYDPAGHLIKQTNALGNTQTWNYDAKTGKLLERANGEQVIRHSYDKSGLLAAIDYGDGQKLTYDYDNERRPLSATGPECTFETSYDEQGRPAATRAACGMDDYLLGYRYNRHGQRTGLLISKLASQPDKPARYETIQQTEQMFDPEGRLSAILTNGIPAISYRHDMLGRPIRKTYGVPKNGRPALSVDIGYDSTGHLGHMTFQGGRLTSPLELTYEWDEADQLTRRTWNGRTLLYEYDRSGQLLKVIDDSDQSVVEAYTYDPAGNMLTKLLHGQLSAMTYNAGNQLVKSYDLGPATPQTVATLPKTPEGLEKLAKSSLSYQYDRAGRMLGTGCQATRTYGWLDKITAIPLPEGGKAAHYYWPDGQLAEIRPVEVPALMPLPPTETFLWDGLALIKRNDTIYLIEPHPSGGIPIASHPVGKPEEITYHLNDLLGTTLATVGPDGVRFTSLTSFGQPLKASNAAAPTSPDTPSAPANPVPTNNQLPPTRQ